MFRRVGDVRIEVKCEGETRLRPDLEIILSDRALLVDVAMVHPSASAAKAQRLLLRLVTLRTRKWRSIGQSLYNVGLLSWHS